MTEECEASGQRTQPESTTSFINKIGGSEREVKFGNEETGHK